MALALMGGGCYSAPVPAPRSQAGEADLAAEALDAGDYTSAAELYRRALTTTPESLPVHYGLAVALSHLDQKPEAIREFRWVLARGETGTVEVDNARRWLIKAGALAPASTGRAARSESPANVEPSNSASAIVEGRVVSAGGPEQGPLKRQQIFLIEQPSRLHHYRGRTDEEGRFRFAGVPPGTYKISDRMSGPPTWRLRVEAKPGQLVLLDLGPGNSTRVRDDYPGHP
jgi:hypothetical protein